MTPILVAVALGLFTGSLLSLFLSPTRRAAAVVALGFLVVPALAAAQTAPGSELVTGAVDLVVKHYPTAAIYLGALPLLQLVAIALAPLAKRTHSTWLYTGLSRFAAFPLLRKP
jgi:hypothetical protein